MTRITSTWFAILAVGVLAVSCSRRSVDDASLTSAIQSKLYADDATKAASIKVDVKGGVVTLSGDVPNNDVELEAMKVANGTAGVSSVNDQMKLNAAAASTPPASGADAQPMSAAGSYPQTSTSSAPPPAPVAPAAPAKPLRTRERSADNSDSSDADARPRVQPSLTVAAGERLQVRMIDGIDSRKNTVGQTFQGTLNAPLVNGNRVIVPAGAPVAVTLTDVSSAGRVRGNSELRVTVSSLTVSGRNYPVSSDVYGDVGKGKGKQTAIRTGIGAAAGALIGGLAGGGKGAAIGAGAGGGAGLGYQVFTHGSQVKIPSESVLTFRLTAPLTIRR